LIDIETFYIKVMTTRAIILTGDFLLKNNVDLLKNYRYIFIKKNVVLVLFSF